MTAYVNADPEKKELILESWASVNIKVFDVLMSLIKCMIILEAILHEVMEQ